MKVTCRSSISSSSDSRRSVAPGRVATVGVARDVPHGAGDLSHALYVTAQAGGHLCGEVACRPPGDVLGEVPASLELGQHAEHGEQVLGLSRVGGPIEQAPLNRRLDSLVEIVDVRVGGHEVSRRLTIGADKGVGSPRDGVLDQSKELDHMAVHQLQVERAVGLTALAVSAGRMCLKGAFDALGP